MRNHQLPAWQEGMMAQPGTFGRRPAPASAARPAARQTISSPTQPEGLFARAQAEATAGGHLALLPPSTGDKGVDEELAEWQAKRKSAFKLTWRQLSLVASLCFGIASFVLPDT